MALIVLFSTFSFTMNSHYCGDYLVDSAWFVDADSCGMSVAKDQHSHEKSIMKDGCCNDVTWTIDGQDDLKITFEDLTHEQQLFVVSFICIDVFMALLRICVDMNMYHTHTIHTSCYYVCRVWRGNPSVLC